MTDQRPYIVFAEPFDRTAMERMSTVGRVTVLDSVNEKNLMEAVADCDALLVRTSTQVSRSMIERAHRLRVIGRGGAGLDNIDIEAAREKGIAVVFTPQAGPDAAADLTVGLMIGLVRKIKTGDEAVRQGQHTAWRTRQSAHELHELTLGIIGMGRIGRTVSEHCHHGFGMKILYNDIVEPEPLGFPAQSLEKNQIYRESDVVSLHVPLTEDTRYLINERTISLFKDGAYLLNTSRGAVVDSLSLARALQTGRLAGAALDVFDPEPLPMDHPLMHAPNTLFTPHIGARTRSSLERMNAVVEDVIRILRDEEPEHPA